MSGDDKKDTCEKEKCSNWKNGKCPFFIQTTWINEQDSTPKVLDDCAHKRSLFTLMEMYNHIMGSKKYASETRNLLQKLADETKEFILVERSESEQTARTIKSIAERQNKMYLEQQKENKK